jgi:Thioesterase domain
VLLVIDGTGVDDDAQYDREMAGSFCNQLAVAPYYHRGPRLAGRETYALATWAVQTVLSEPGRGQVQLAGYSRGGCAAIIACRLLAGHGVRVSSLFLFDAVDMQLSEAHLNRTIQNVDFVAHARSARSLGFWAMNPVRSRFYFYNTGVSVAAGGTYVERAFRGTHAALGGTPWVDIGADAGCATDVADWMSGQLAGRGVHTRLSVKGKSTR